MLNLKDEATYRFAYEELILRLFAFSEERSRYKGGLANFLNNYMDNNRSLDNAEIEQKRHNFERAINLLYVRMGGRLNGRYC